MRKSEKRLLIAAGGLLGGYLLYKRFVKPASDTLGNLFPGQAAATPTDQLVGTLADIGGYVTNPFKLYDAVMSPQAAPQQAAPQGGGFPNIGQMVAEATAGLLGSASSAANVTMYRTTHQPRTASPYIEQKVGSGAMSWGQFGAFTNYAAPGYSSGYSAAPQAPNLSVPINAYNQAVALNAQLKARSVTASLPMVAATQSSTRTTTAGASAAVAAAAPRPSGTIFATRYAPGYTPGVGWKK